MARGKSRTEVVSKNEILEVSEILEEDWKLFSLFTGFISMDSTILWLTKED